MGPLHQDCSCLDPRVLLEKGKHHVTPVVPNQGKSGQNTVQGEKHLQRSAANLVAIERFLIAHLGSGPGINTADFLCLKEAFYNHFRVRTVSTGKIEPLGR